MFDSHISGEVPEHRDFIYGTAIPALERMGVKIRILRGLQTYVGLFTGRITRGPKKGLLRSFPICGRCAVQRDCKLKPILRYQKSLPPDTVQYIGIARDEQERLLRLDGRRVSLLDKDGYTEQDAKQLCREAGLLSPVSPTGAAAGSAPTPGDGNSAISMTTTRICGPGCWNCRPCRERSLRSLTGPRHFRKLTQVFGVKMNNSAYGKTPHSGEGRFHAKSYHKFDLIWRSAGAGRRFPSNAAGSAPEGWCLREHRF